MQFQTKKPTKSKRKAPSSPPVTESAECSSTDSQSSLSLVKIRKAGTAKQIPQTTAEPKKRVKGNIVADNSEASAAPRKETPAKKSDIARAKHRQRSADWPTILPEDDEQEAANDVKSQESEQSPCETQDLAPQPQHEGSASEPIMDAKEDLAPSKAGPKPVPIEEETRSAERSGPLPPHNFNNSCSPSLDTRSYADMLAEALAGSASSVSTASPREGGDSLLMFECSGGHVSNGKDAGYEREQSRGIDIDDAYEDAGETRSQQESTVNHDFNVYDDTRQSQWDDTYEARPASVDTVSRGNGLPCMDFLSSSPHLAFPLIDEMADETFSPTLSSPKCAESDLVQNPEMRNVTETKPLDIFGTDAESARQTLYGRG